MIVGVEASFGGGDGGCRLTGERGDANGGGKAGGEIGGCTITATGETPPSLGLASSKIGEDKKAGDDEDSGLGL